MWRKSINMIKGLMELVCWCRHYPNTYYEPFGKASMIGGSSFVLGYYSKHDIDINCRNYYDYPLWFSNDTTLINAWFSLTLLVTMYNCSWIQEIIYFPHCTENIKITEKKHSLNPKINFCLLLKVVENGHGSQSVGYKYIVENKWNVRNKHLT